MAKRTITVNDEMQRGYRYQLVEPAGRNFDPEFTPDLTPKEIQVVAATQGPTFSGIFDEKLTQAAYETKPSWYIVAKHDQMIPPAAEAAMAKAIGAKVTELSTSHVAMLAKPREVADVILAAATSVK